jgi:hypothetical protein
LKEKQRSFGIHSTTHHHKYLSQNINRRPNGSREGNLTGEWHDPSLNKLQEEVEQGQDERKGPWHAASSSYSSPSLTWQALSGFNNKPLL